MICWLTEFCLSSSTQLNSIKDEARIFRVTDFKIFYESHEYRWDNFRPSSPDPRLTQALKDSRLLDSNRVYKLTFQDDLQIFSSLLYNILSTQNIDRESAKNKPNNQSLFRTKILIIILGLFLVLSSSIIVGTRYYLNHINESAPTTNN